MRIGLAEKTVLVALAHASVYSENSSSKNQASLEEVTALSWFAASNNKYLIGKD